MNALQLHPIAEQIYKAILQYPTKSDTTLGKELNLSHTTVNKYRKKLYSGLTHHLARDVAGKFFTHFQMASDYFMTQIEKLEVLKEEAQSFKESGTKTVFRKATDGHSYSEEEKLNAFDKLTINREIAALEKQQTDVWAKIIFMCRQSEAIEVMKMIENGVISIST